jgi:hypothetical protein
MRSVVMLSVCVLAGGAFGQSVRDTVVTDVSGASLVREHRAPMALGGDSGVPRGGLLWTYVDSASITESVALGGGGDHSWVGHSLNDKRASLFETTGDGTPEWVYSLASDNPQVIGVAAAADASLGAVFSYPTGGPITVRGFEASGGGTPAWTYTFPASYTNSGKRAVAVNADGTRVAVCAYDGTDSQLLILDGDGNTVNSTIIAGYCAGVELDDSGGRAVVTAGSVARLYDTSTMTELHSLSVSGTGGYHRISRDGTAIAAGGFNIRAAREVGGSWQNVYSGTGSQDWFGWGVALSGDGETLFVLSHNYGDGYLTNGHRLIDLTTGTEIGRTSYTGSGGLQNSAVGARANQDGTLFVAASWGDEFNTRPEVRIYDRDLALVGSIDSEGSPFEVDMSRDGRYVLVGSKAVHANTFGNGGRTYAYETDSCSDADFNGDGDVNTQDVLAFLNAWNNQDPASDCNGDGDVNTQDVLCFLNVWNSCR